MATKRSLKQAIEGANHLNLANALYRLERDIIIEAMDMSMNNRTMAARLLGISRTKLVYKLKEYEEYIKSLY